jgi:hypothetical protein
MRTAKLAYRCTKCGGDEFLHPSNPKPSDIMTCGACGQTAHFQEAQWAAIEEAKKLLAAAFPGVKWD